MEGLRKRMCSSLTIKAKKFQNKQKFKMADIGEGITRVHHVIVTSDKANVEIQQSHRWCHLASLRNVEILHL